MRGEGWVHRSTPGRSWEAFCIHSESGSHTCRTRGCGQCSAAPAGSWGLETEELWSVRQHNPIAISTQRQVLPHPTPQGDSDKGWLEESSVLLLAPHILGWVHSPTPSSALKQHQILLHFCELFFLVTVLTTLMSSCLSKRYPRI